MAIASLLTVLFVFVCDVVVPLFGGYDGYGVNGETWEWDGVTWIQRRPIARPPARYGHAMAYDALRQRVEVLGPREAEAVAIERPRPGARPGPRG